MELSRKARKREEMRPALQRIYAAATLAAVAAGLAFVRAAGGPLAFTCGAALVFFGFLLINYLGVRRFIPGLNARQPRAKAAAVSVYLLAAIALIALAGLRAHP